MPRGKFPDLNGGHGGELFPQMVCVQLVPDVRLLLVSDSKRRFIYFLLAQINQSEQTNNLG